MAASPAEKAASEMKAAAPVAPAFRTAALDLRPPASMSAVLAIGQSEPAHRSQVSGDTRFAELGAAMNQQQSNARVEAFMQRFHKEGLPLARLWEGRESLVSLGLNQKGKPGLWLIKQTH